MTRMTSSAPSEVDDAADQQRAGAQSAGGSAGFTGSVCKRFLMSPIEKRSRHRAGRVVSRPRCCEASDAESRRGLRYRVAMRLPIAWLFACLVIPLGAIAAPKRIPTHEDIWLMKRVSAPQVSPDGRWIVASVIEPAYDDNAQLSDLWLIDATAQQFQPPPDLDAPARRAASPGARTAGASSSARSATTTTWRRSTRSISRRAARRSGSPTCPAARARPCSRTTAGSWRSCRSCIRRRATTRLTRSASRRIARARRTSASSTASRSAAGIAGSTSARRASSSRRSTRTVSPRAARAICSPAPALAASAGFAGRQTDTGEEIEIEFTPDNQAHRVRRHHQSQCRRVRLHGLAAVRRRA